MMAWGRYIMYLDGKHATLTQVPIDGSGTCCQIVCCAIRWKGSDFSKTDSKMD
jgi:hypothetical protein